MKKAFTHKDEIKLQALLQELKEGSNGAYREFETLFRVDLEYFVYRLINDKNDARMIVVENLGKMYQLRNGFNTVSDLKSFLYVSCRNSAYDYLRSLKYKRKNEVLVDDIEEHIDLSEQDKMAQAETEAIRTELYRTMYEQISLLAPRQQLVMQLVLKGKKTAEIAESLDLKETLVRQLKSRAIKTIRHNVVTVSAQSLYYILIVLLKR